MKACCGFGHRNVFENIGDKLDNAVEAAIQQGCEIFYTGATVSCCPQRYHRQISLLVWIQQESCQFPIRLKLCLRHWWKLKKLSFHRLSVCRLAELRLLKKQMSILSESEAMLTERLTGDEKKAFLSFVDASDVILGESELGSFIVRFRLGARLIFDTLVNDDTPYDDLLNEHSEWKARNIIFIWRTMNGEPLSTV